MTGRTFTDEDTTQERATDALQGLRPDDGHGPRHKSRARAEEGRQAEGRAALALPHRSGQARWRVPGREGQREVGTCRKAPPGQRGIPVLSSA